MRKTYFFETAGSIFCVLWRLTFPTRSCPKQCMKSLHNAKCAVCRPVRGDAPGRRGLRGGSVPAPLVERLRLLGPRTNPSKSCGKPRNKAGLRSFQPNLRAESPSSTRINTLWPRTQSNKPFSQFWRKSMRLALFRQKRIR